MSASASFRAGLTDPAAPVPHGLTDGTGAPAGRRYDVYRNNVMQSLTDVMRAGFPVVRKLLGPANFDVAATTFVRAHPPLSPIMQRYGDEFPAFLAKFAPVAHIGYLADAARLDHALRAAYHAADAPPLDASVFGALTPEQMPGVTLRFAPAVCLMRSDWPLFDIWRFNTETNAPKPAPVAQSVLITRPAFDPEPHALTPAQGAWIAALMAGDDLGAAQDAAIAVDATCDIAPALTLLIAENALTGLTRKDPK